jgi:hypothetical protein
MFGIRPVGKIDSKPRPWPNERERGTRITLLCEEGLEFLEAGLGSTWRRGRGKNQSRDKRQHLLANRPPAEQSRGKPPSGIGAAKSSIKESITMKTRLPHQMLSGYRLAAKPGETRFPGMTNVLLRRSSFGIQTLATNDRQLLVQEFRPENPDDVQDLDLGHAPTLGLSRSDSRQALQGGRKKGHVLHLDGDSLQDRNGTSIQTFQMPSVETFPDADSVLSRLGSPESTILLNPNLLLECLQAVCDSMKDDPKPVIELRIHGKLLPLEIGFETSAGLPGSLMGRMILMPVTDAGANRAHIGIPEIIPLTR